MARATPPIEDTKPDMTPMIDMIFQLIVFFALVNDFSKLERIAELTIPEANSVNMAKYKEPLVVNVLVSGRWNVRGEVMEEARLRKWLEDQARLQPSTDPADPPGISDALVYIRGDANAEYQYVTKVMYLAQLAGLWKISFAGTKPRT